MKWQNVIIELDVDSITVAFFIFSVLSGLCSLITILIYLRMKSLRTLIYKFFLHVAINELASRFAYLLLYIFGTGVIFFRISTFILYFTDTNILALLSFTCMGMYQLILKQNKKLLSKFKKIAIILYSFSMAITIIFFILSHQNAVNGKDPDLYRNAICLYFIKDSDKNSFRSQLFTNIVYYTIIIFAFVNIFLILIFIRDKTETTEYSPEKNSTNEDQNIKKSLKLRTFRIKLITYPIIALIYYTPQIIYTWIEYNYLQNTEEYKDNLDYLRIRYIFYNLYTFVNSIRGFLFFNLFIKNEKIKKFLFEKYLNFKIFKTIDKINVDGNKNTNKIIEDLDLENKTINRDYTLDIEASFDNILFDKKKSKNKKKLNINTRRSSDEKIMDDDSDDDDDNFPNRDYNSEIIKHKKSKL